MNWSARLLSGHHCCQIFSSLQRSTVSGAVWMTVIIQGGAWMGKMVKYLQDFAKQACVPSFSHSVSYFVFPPWQTCSPPLLIVFGHGLSGGQQRTCSQGLHPRPLAFSCAFLSKIHEMTFSCPTSTPLQRSVGRQLGKPPKWSVALVWLRG